MIKYTLLGFWKMIEKYEGSGEVEVGGEEVGGVERGAKEEREDLRSHADYWILILCQHLEDHRPLYDR